MHTQSTHLQKGFSLVEMMVVMFIIAVLGAIALPMYQSYAEGARRDSTIANVRSLKQAIGMFQLQLNSYPIKLEDLAQRPAGDIGKRWSAYLGKVPKDSWGFDFKYKITAGGKHPYELYSYGGEAGPEEDPTKRINVWDL